MKQWCVLFAAAMFCFGANRAAAARPATPPPPRDVALETADHVELAATYYPPVVEEGDVTPAVILLHEANRTRQIWDPFAQLLQRNGLAVLAVDLRGHGASVRRMGPNGPERLDIAKFTPNDYAAMLLDVEAAWDFLSSQLEVDSLRVAIIGSVLGANLALRYAVINEDVAALVLLSPLADYEGLRAGDAMEKLAHVPLRLVVAAADQEAFDAATQLLARRRSNVARGGGPPELIATSGLVRGTDLLRRVEGLPGRILAWLREQFALGASVE